MSGKTVGGLPLWTIILDGVGTLLLALGIFIQFGGDAATALLPEGLHDGGIMLIITGALLMAPLVIAVVQKATAASR